MKLSDEYLNQLKKLADSDTNRYGKWQRLSTQLGGKPETIRMQYTNHFADVNKMVPPAEAAPVTQEGTIIAQLNSMGFEIVADGDKLTLVRNAAIQPGGHRVINVDKLEAKKYRFMLVSDTHLASKWERLDVLQTAYDDAHKQGIADVYHTGNVVDGQGTYNQFEVKVTGATAQTDYAIKNYPARDGITTYYLSTNCHTGRYWRELGVDYGRFLEAAMLQAGRKDFVHLGFQQADVELKGDGGHSIMRLIHPAGGCAYSLSYKPQKIVESFTSGTKPNLLLLGHWHVSGYFEQRNVHCFLAGCMQDQSSYMQRKHLQPHIGYWVIEVMMTSKGIVTGVKSEWKSFYDKEFYVTHSLYVGG